MPLWWGHRVNDVCGGMSIWNHLFRLRTWDQSAVTFVRGHSEPKPVPTQPLGWWWLNVSNTDFLCTICRCLRYPQHPIEPKLTLFLSCLICFKFHAAKIQNISDNVIQNKPKNNLSRYLSPISCALVKCLQYVIQSSLGYFGTHRRIIYPREKIVDSSRIFFRMIWDIRKRQGASLRPAEKIL